MKRYSKFLFTQLVTVVFFLTLFQKSFSQGAYSGSGNWIELDGVDDYASITDNSSLDIGNGASDSFTIECFFFIPNLDSSDSQTLIYKNLSYNLNLIMSNSSQDRIVFRIYSNPVTTHSLIGFSDLSVGWHHVAAVFVNAPASTADTMKIFLDGTVIGSSSSLVLDPGINNSTASLYVGAYIGVNPFYGRIDEIRISDIIRYSESSYSIPASDFSVDSDTRALWHFSESIGSTSFSDATSNNNVLSGINGAATLPVQLSSFSVTQYGSQINLIWVTETEINTYGYDIERRVAGTPLQDWIRIGFVQGAGTSNSKHEYIYQDNVLLSGHYTYRIKQIDNDGAFEYYGNTEVKVIVSSLFALEQNYPNPFNPATNIGYQLPKDGYINLTVHDVLGRAIAELVNGQKQAGYYKETWNASVVGSGIYFYSLTVKANDGTLFKQIRKMVLMK